jgi:hypothetical protein
MAPPKNAPLTSKSAGHFPFLCRLKRESLAPNPTLSHEGIGTDDSSFAMGPLWCPFGCAKMCAETRKMFVNARHAEQDVRERQASRNF